MNEKSCPCKRTDCPRHGDYAACREHHATVKKGAPAACDRIRAKAQGDAERTEKRKRP